jgi:hypothetical protein
MKNVWRRGWCVGSPQLDGYTQAEGMLRDVPICGYRSTGHTGMVVHFYAHLWSHGPLGADAGCLSDPCHNL